MYRNTMTLTLTAAFSVVVPAIAADTDVPILSGDGAREVIAEAVGERIGTDQFTRQELALQAGPAGEFELVVTIDGAGQRLVLQPHSVRAQDFRVRVQDARGRLRKVAPPPARTYRGYLAGIAGSQVVASVVDGEVAAQVRTGPEPDDVWVIEPLRRMSAGVASSSHVVYRSSDAPSPEGSCATHAPDDGWIPLPSLAPTDVSADGLVCEIACDADFEYYVLNNSSVDDTVADIEMIINGASAIYELDVLVTFEITEIIVRAAESDPYDQTDPYALLAQVTSEWENNQTGISRDVAELFTGKDMAGTTIGIAWLNQVCPGLDHYSVVQSGWSSDLAERIALSAHEIGHNFDARHCDYGDFWCRIMCSALGECSGGYHSFSPTQATRIQSTAAGRSCLDTDTITLPSTELPFFDDFQYSGYDPDPAKWTAGDRVELGGNIYYNRFLEIKVGQGYTQNQRLGTVRTLPMAVNEATTISYLTCQNYVQSGQSLRVEYFNSTLWQWVLLEAIYSSGVGTNDFIYHEHPVPVDGYGDYFALRFSGYGPRSGSRDWRVDDVAVTPDSMIPPKIASCEVAVAHDGSTFYGLIADGYVEPRVCGLSEMRVCFDRGMDTSVTDPNVVAIVGVAGGPQAAPDIISWESDQCMVIELGSPLPDMDSYTMTLGTELLSASGVPLDGDRDVPFGVLAGDVSGDGLVDNSDVIAVRVKRGEAVTEENTRYDADCDGVISNIDMRAIRVLRGNQFP